MANTINMLSKDSVKDDIPGIIDISNDYFTNFLHSLWPNIETMPFFKFILIIAFGYIVAKLTQLLVVGVT